MGANVCRTESTCCGFIEFWWLLVWVRSIAPQELNSPHCYMFNQMNALYCQLSYLLFFVAQTQINHLNHPSKKKTPP